MRIACSKREAFRQWSWILVFCFLGFLLTGCVTKQTRPMVHPVTGAVLMDLNGQPLMESRWVSQVTLRQENELNFIRSHNSLGPTGIVPVQDEWQPTETDTAEVKTLYLTQRIVEAAQVSPEQYARIRGEPSTDIGVMYAEHSKSERHRESLSIQKLGIYSNLALGVAQIGVDLYEIEKGYRDDLNGGIYINDSNITTTQTASNSGGGERGDVGEGSVTETNRESRQINQSVFGSGANGIAYDDARQPITGDGPTIQLETSANGFAADNSEIKSSPVADEFTLDTFAPDDEDASPKIGF